MKTRIMPPTGELNQSQRLTALFPFRLAIGALAFVGLVATANAQTTYVKNSSSIALNTTGSYTVAGVPTSLDTIQFDNNVGLLASIALGGDLSVSGITQPTNGVTAIGQAFSINTGNTLTIGAGGILKDVTAKGFTISCNVALSANQTWKINATTGSGLVFQGSSFADNGHSLLITNIPGVQGLFDVRTAGAMTFGPNVSINVGQLNINNAAADVTLGGANIIKTLLIAAGTVEGSSFPADTGAATTSNFGSAISGNTVTFGAGTATSGTLIYNGTTAATPKTFTMTATGTNVPTIKVSTAGQTLTISNIAYASGTSQTIDRSWYFGGAGNLAIMGKITNSGSVTYKIGIVKNDAGTLTLGGTNGYTGNTLVNGGTLALTGNGSISNTPSIVLAGGATFDVSGKTSTFGLQTGQSISNNATATATLIGNINANSGTLAGSFKSGLAPFTIQNGTLTLSASTVINLTSLNPRLTVGTILPIVAKGTGGTVAGTAPNTTPGSLTVGGLTGHFAINSGELDFVVDSSTPAGIEPLHWAASGSGTWDAANTGNTIWKDSTTPTALTTYFVNGDTVQFDEKYISANQAVTLNSTVSPTSMLVSNSTYNYTISGSGTIGGIASLTKTGSGSLTLSTSNSYSGGTAISNGAVIMGNGTALGGNGSTVSVASGAVLDVNGTTNGTANTYALTINGSGPSGGGALIDGVATAANFFGSVTLAGDSTIKQNGASFTFGSSGSSVPINGNYVLTVGGPSGFIVDVFGSISVGSIIKVDAGQLKMESANTFAGGLTVLNGNVSVKNAAAFGTGPVTMLDTTGNNGAKLGLGVTGNINNPMIVQAGSTGTASIDNFGGSYTPVWAGGITLNNGLTLATTVTGSQGYTSVSGPISGSGALTIANTGPTVAVKLYGTNTYTGATYITVGSLALLNNASISNSAVISISDGATLDVSGLTSGIFTIASGQTLANNGGTATLNGTVDASSCSILATFDGATPTFAVTSLILGSGTAFTVNPTTILPVGTYTLIASGVSGTAPATVNLLRGAGYLQITGGALQLVVTSTASGVTEPLHWTGAGLWQVATPTNAWKDSAVLPVFTGYADADSVQFDEQFISADQVVTLNYLVTPASIVVSNAAHSYTFISTAGSPGAIAGNGSLTKSGAGTFVLNTSTGTNLPVTVNGGTLSGIGTIGSTLTVNNGGTLASGTNGVYRLTVLSNLTLNAGSTTRFSVTGGAPSVNWVNLGTNANVTYGGTLSIVPTGTFNIGDQYTLFAGINTTNASNFTSITGSAGSGKAFAFTNGILSVVVGGPSGPANLTNSYSGGVLSLSWPAGQGWKLQAQTNNLSIGLGTNWTDMTDGTVSSTNITVNPANPTVFYRLKY